MGAADRERAASRCRRRLLESLAKSLDAQQDFSDVGLDELPFSRQLDLSADFSVEPNAAEIFQRLHLLENRRFADAQRLRRPCDVEMF